MRYEAQFTLTPADMMTGFRMHFRQSDNILKIYLFGAVAVLTLCGVAAYSLQLPIIAIAGAVLTVVVVGTFSLKEIALRRQANRVPAETVSYVFSDVGVEFTSSIAQSKLSWSAFTEARLDERGLVLYTSRMTFSFIPARAFVTGYFPRAEIKALMAAMLKDV
ncbi:MAG: YcxB family protein [Opitutaceae bacterium]|nr:YcxB family protein [Opitutaceae bacterium]